jgi:hypothetical protein
MPHADARRPQPATARRRLLLALPLIFVAAIVLAVPASVVLDLPGEREVKTALGVSYSRACAPAPPDPRSAWVVDASLPGEVDEPGGAVWTGSAYLVGGRGRDGMATDAVLRYDLGTRRVQALPPLPAVRDHVGAAVLGDQLYVAGGWDVRRNDRGFDDLWRLTLPTGRWERLAPMPTRRGGLALVAHGAMLYAIGGRDRGASLAAVEAYDTRTGRWSKAPPMPSRRDHVAAASVGGAIYALGGRQEDKRDLRVLERYVPQARRWERVADQPEALSGQGLATVGGGRLIVAGGEDIVEPSSASAGVWSYDPRLGRWAPLPAMPTPRHGHTAVVGNDRIFVLGGSTCPGFGPSPRVDSLPLPATAPRGSGD